MNNWRLIYKGVKGEDVLNWQTFLTTQGYKVGNLDSVFGAKTDLATRLWQGDNGLIDDGIVGRMSVTRAIELGFDVEVTELVFTRDIYDIIGHITASNDNATVQDIRKGHLLRGFSDIGYHFIVDRAGVCHPGRPLDTIGAHCAGMNAHSIGIAYIARGSDTKSNEPYGTYMTEPQRITFEKKVAELLKICKLKVEDFSGHNDHNKGKACPCFQVKRSTDLLANIKALM